LLAFKASPRKLYMYSVTIVLNIRFDRLSCANDIDEIAANLPDAPDIAAVDGTNKLTKKAITVYFLFLAAMNIKRIKEFDVR
jgi:hypothetical protein